MTSVISEYEVFRNEQGALAFFFARADGLDGNAPEGPFWFTVDGGRILAGTATYHAVFEDIRPDVLAAARDRGVLVMIEFEDQTPVRCTPCYFADRL